MNTNDDQLTEPGAPRAIQWAWRGCGSASSVGAGAGLVGAFVVLIVYWGVAGGWDRESLTFQLGLAFIIGGLGGIIVGGAIGAIWGFIAGLGSYESEFSVSTLRNVVIGILLVPIAICAIGAFGSKSQTRAVVLIQQGFEHEQNGEYDKAIAAFTQAIDIAPEDPKPYFGRGNAHFNTKQFDQAIADYSQVIRLNPDDAIARYNRGNSYFNVGKFRDAVADYTAAIRQDNHEFDDATLVKIYLNRGDAFSKTDDHDSAIGDYTEVTRIDPRNAEAYFKRGNAYLKKEDFSAAISNYTNSIEINPDNAEPYWIRALVYQSLGQTEKAHKDKEAAVRINPSLAEN